MSKASSKRQPQVVLIDELAHTNTPGSKNEKRYQDVFDILDHQINVITTLNVQHLESVASKRWNPAHEHCLGARACLDNIMSRAAPNHG